MSKRAALLSFIIIAVLAFVGGYVLRYTQTSDLLRVAASDKVSQRSYGIDDEKLHGLPSDEVKAILSPRSRWSTSGNLCGEYAAAMLLILTDNYFGGNIIDEGTSYHNDELKDRLITDKERTFGTDPVSMMMSVNSHFQEGSSASSRLITGDEINDYVNDGHPVTLLLSALSPENPYGSHWVCAYSYCEEEDMYCVCDGWGNFRAFVPASSVLCGVVIDSGTDERTNIAQERDGLEDVDATKASIYVNLLGDTKIYGSLDDMIKALREKTTDLVEQKNAPQIVNIENSSQENIDKESE